MITDSVVLRYHWKGTTKVMKAYVAEIGRQDLILGHEWLQKENPAIDWRSGLLEFENTPKDERDDRLGRGTSLRTISTTKTVPEQTIR